MSSEPRQRSESQERKLSYVGLSCHVSGYNDFNRYNSTLRQGFRDSSRERRAPRNMYTNGDCLMSPLQVKAVCKQQYRASNRSVSMDRARKVYYTEKEIFINGQTPRKDVLKNGDYRAMSLDDEYEESLANGKSFIQQRIDRLYRAAGSGQERGRERSRHIENKENVIKPVFGYLSSDFRQQLTNKSKPLVSPKVVQSFIQKPSDNNNRTYVSEVRQLVNGHSNARGEMMNDVSVKPAHNDTPRKANGHVVVDTIDNISCDKRVQSSEVTKDGHYFIKVMSEERRNIEVSIKQTESDLQSGQIPEDVTGTLRAAIGQANLLIQKKFKQFQSLCDKNITPQLDQTIVTSEDLAGFWDLVGIQVDKIHDMFRHIEELRQNSWKETKVITKSSPSKNVPKPRKSSEARKSTDAGKDRAAERKRQMAEAKKRMQQQKEEQPTDGVQIFH